MRQQVFLSILALLAWPPALLGQAAADGPSAAEAPPAYEYNDKRPGQSQRLPRAWEGAPPLVPHAIRGLTPITGRNNACVRCHGRAGATTGPPPAPASHFVDTREAPGVARPQVAGARWICTACHVPQTNAPPLVSTTEAR